MYLPPKSHLSEREVAENDAVSDITFYKIRSITDAMLETSALKGIYEAARNVSRGVYVEIGPAQGGSTIAIALGRRAAGRQEMIYTADVFRGSDALKTTNIDVNVKVLNRNLKQFGLDEGVEVIVVGRDDIETAVPVDAEIGLLFIDADGALDRDFAQFYDRVAPGGFIILDDCEERVSDKYVLFTEGRLERYVLSKKVETLASLTPLGKHYTVFKLARRLIDLGLVEELKTAKNTIFLRKIGNQSYTQSGAPAAMAETREAIAEEFLARREKHFPSSAASAGTAPGSAGVRVTEKSGAAPIPEAPAAKAPVRLSSESESIFCAREPRCAKFILATVRDFIFDELSRREAVVRFVHVGAHDGVSVDDNQPADPLRARVLKQGWQGLLIEPGPEAFARLKVNYGPCGVDFANVAIWSSEGEKTFHVVEGADWLSSFFPETILRHDDTQRDLRSKIRPIEVQVRRLDSLCRERGHTQPDVLLVDAEGCDDIVLRTFDFSIHRPDVVQFNHFHLSTQASSDLGDWLTGLGYELLFDRQNVLGLNRTRFDPRLVRFCQDLLFAARAN